VTALAARRFRRQRRHRLKLILASLWCAVFAIVFLLPTVLTITNSFMSPSEISANYGVIFEQNEQGGKKFMSERVNLKFIPDIVTFGQYAKILLLGPEYLLKFWNSVKLVVPIVIFQVAVAALAAYSFTRLRGRLRGMLFFVYIIIMLMPHQVAQVPNFMMAQRLGIIDTDWAIILPGIFTPFSVFILTKSMRRIPYSMIEAAKLDGAGEWSIFSRICAPMCKGAMYSVAILVFIDYWNMVEQPLIMLSDPETYPLSVFLSQINAGEISLAFAAATIYMVPPILLFLHGEEYLVEGITYAGGLKG
jgi:multiple sugar transport system permease protein